jgi:hypothetical protein
VEIAFSVSSKTVTSSGGQLNQTSSLNNFPAREEIVLLVGMLLGFVNAKDR